MTTALATVETRLMLPAPEWTLEDAQAAAVEAVRQIVPAASVWVKVELASYGHVPHEPPARRWEVSVLIGGRQCAIGSNADFERALADVLLKVRDMVTVCPYCGRR